MKDVVKAVVVQGATGGLEKKEDNIKHILDNVEMHGADSDIIVFPELVVQGYVRESSYDFKVSYYEAAEESQGPTTKRIIEAAQKADCYVAFGMAERSSIPMLLYNSFILVGPEGYVGTSRKMHLAMVEKEYFLPGAESSVFNTRIGKLGLMTCYDLFFPEPARILALKGAEIIVHTAAAMGGGADGGVGKTGDKKRFFETAGIVRAIENQCHFIGGDRVGTHYMGEHFGTWKPMGLSKIINNFGVVLASAKFGEEDVIKAELTNKDLINGRSVYPLLKDRNPNNYKIICRNEL